MTLPPGRLRLADKPNLHWVCARFEDNRYGRGYGLCSECCWSAGRGNDGYPRLNQFGRKLLWLIIVALGLAIFD